jgi:hypothetical protein
MAEDHDDDNDIVERNPVAGKGNKPPQKPPPKPQFTPIKTYQGEAKCLLPDDVDCESPSGIFQYILPDSVIQTMCKATNKAGREAFQAKGSTVDWKDVTTAEMYAFLGILCYDSVYRAHTWKEYWNTDPYKAIHQAVRKAMPRDRFCVIHRYFECQVDPLTSKYPFPRVQDLSDWLLERFKGTWRPSGDLCVDETVAPYTGRKAVEIVKITSKPHSKGQKIWILSDGQYVLGWFWHAKGLGQGQGPIGIDFEKYKAEDFSRTECIVPEFMLSLGAKAEGRHFWTDSVFTTTPVALWLRQRNVAITGITRTSKTQRDFVEKDGLSAEKAADAAKDQRIPANLGTDPIEIYRDLLPEVSQGANEAAGSSEPGNTSKSTPQSQPCTQPRRGRKKKANPVNTLKPPPKGKPQPKGANGLHPDLVRVAFESPNAIPIGSEYQYVDKTGTVLQIAYKDNKLLIMVTTGDSGKEPRKLVSKKTRPKGKNAKNDVYHEPETWTPTYVIGYRSKAKAVDQADQLASYYTTSTHRKANSRRWLVNFTFLLDRVNTNAFLMSSWPKEVAESGNWRAHRDFQLQLANELMEFNDQAGNKAIQLRLRRQAANEVMKQRVRRPQSEAIRINHARLYPDGISALPDGRKREYCTSCKAVGRETDQSVYIGRSKPRQPMTETTLHNRKRAYEGDVDKMAHKRRTSRSNYGCRSCGLALCRSNRDCWDWHVVSCNL